MKNFLKAREVNGKLFFGLILLLVATGLSARDRISDVVLGIAIAIGVVFGLVGAFQMMRGTSRKAGQVNSNLFFGLILLVVATGLNDRISDLALGLAIAIGAVFSFVGVAQMSGKGKT